MLTIEQLTSVKSQMTLKGAAITAKIVADAVRLKMRADIENPAGTCSLSGFLPFAINLHFNELADSLDNNCPHYPDDVDTIDTLRDQVAQNMLELGFDFDA